MATSRIRWARQAPVLLRSIVQRRTFTATPAQRSEADNHRRGRPVTQMEAGFKEPHSPIRFGRFLAIGTAFCVAGLVWTYMPGSYHTEIGMEMRDKALGTPIRMHHTREMCLLTL